MPDFMTVSPRFRPVLDPNFVPACLWNRDYRALVEANGDARNLAIALERTEGSTSVFRTRVLPHEGSNVALNERYVERLLKFLLWQKGGRRIVIGGDPQIADFLRRVYSPTGPRAFDHEFMGQKVYGRPFTVESGTFESIVDKREPAAPLGRHLDGCRICRRTWNATQHRSTK